MKLFDIETDGLLSTLTKIHCICIIDLDTNKEYSYDYLHIDSGIRMLQQAINQGEEICGHNIITFDIPAIQKLCPEFTLERTRRNLVVDTLTLSYLLFNTIGDSDCTLIRRGVLPKDLGGSHKLEAWGYRLGILKGTYGKGEGSVWSSWNPEMQKYCMQDVRVTLALYKAEMAQMVPKDALELEYKAQWLMAKQQRNGFPFDIEKAEKLKERLEVDYAKYYPRIIETIPEIPSKFDTSGKSIPFIPKRDNKRLGYKKDVPVYKMKDFNPNSHKQLEWVIRHHYNYTPNNEGLYDESTLNDAVFNPSKCRLKTDEETLEFILKAPDAPQGLKDLIQLVLPVLTIKKRLGQLSTGKQNWFKHYKEEDGCIHGRVIPNATVSGRAAHSKPNIGQIPAVHSLYGKECRELFNSNYKGNEWLQVGLDASGLELRCLAHYMYPYDNGAYGHEILNGDIHSANQKAAGLPTRDQAKTFIYGFLYGAGDAKMGQIVGGNAQEGHRLKSKFLKATPAIKQLRSAVQNTLVERHLGNRIVWKRKYLLGLDGRKLHVRSPHSALNLLLQSAGALICKYWITKWEDLLVTKYQLRHGWNGDFCFLMWVHDEEQIAVRNKEIAEIVIKAGHEAMELTQEHYKFRIKLDCEAKVGRNWADCH